MAYQYEFLTADDRASLGAQRVRQFEAEHFSWTLNLATAKTLPDGEEKDAVVAAATKALADLENAIAVTKAQAAS